jgi:Dolichyl-phosphate-mannose-protein mannosyltransferase
VSARVLAVAHAALLAIGCCGAVTVFVLLCGRGDLLLGPGSPARASAFLLVLLSLAAGALSLRPLLRLFEPLPTSAGSDRPPGWLNALAAAAGLALVAALFEQTRRWPDAGWDAWMIWNLRARALLRTGGDLAVACSGALARADFGFHPSYPLLRPGLVALGWRIAGQETPWVSAGLSFACAAIVLALLFAEVARRSGRTAGLLAATVFATTPMLAEQAAGGIAETLLCALTLCAAVLLSAAEDAPEGRRRALWTLAGLALGVSTSVKNEGALFLLAFLVAAGPKCAGRMLLGAAGPVALTLWFKLGLAPLDDLITPAMGARALHALAPRRVAMLLLATARRVVFFQQWGVHLVAALLFLGLRRARGPLSPLTARLLLVVALVLLGDAAVYLTTPWDLDWHLRTSMDRLILQVWPIALLAFGSSWPAGEASPSPITPAPAST